MIVQKIFIEDYKWTIYIYCFPKTNEEINKLVAHLNRYNCPAEDVRYIKSAIPRRKDIAFTYTAENSNTTIIGISEVSNCDELTNSIVHELNHAKIAILSKFNINLEGEAAAYLIGELAKEAHKLIKVCILTRP